MINPTTEKQRYWLRHIEAAERSELSTADYARANNITAQRLYQWRNLLKSKTTTVSTQINFTQVVSLSGGSLTIQQCEAQFELNVLPGPLWLSTLI